MIGFTDDALEKMHEYAWPGNVRELRNVVERAVVLGTRAALDASDIWLSSLETFAVKDGKLNYGYQPQSLDAMEKEHIGKTLEYTAWNKSQAAAILNIEARPSIEDQGLRPETLSPKGAARLALRRNKLATGVPVLGPSRPPPSAWWRGSSPWRPHPLGSWAWQWFQEPGAIG